MLPEITSPVEIAIGDRLNPAAVGWSRRALHRSNQLRKPGRTKRWEYWGIFTERFVVGLTIVDLSYAHMAHVYVFDREGKTEDAFARLRPGPIRPRMSGELPPFVVSSGPIRFTDGPDGSRLQVEHRRVKLDLAVAPGGDALGVVVPWSENLFQYTLKDLNRPVSGTITVNGVTDSSNGFAVLDRGRGIWPRAKRWNWGVGNGTVDGTGLGLQFGGKWTDGTGSTENGLFVNGELHYWPEELTWEYDLNDPASTWRVHGECVDAVLTPFHRRRDVTNAVVVQSRIHQAFGVWTGWAKDSAGNKYRLDGLEGWAEEADNVW